MTTNFELVKSETVPLTRDLVEHWVNMKPSPTERELKLPRVKHLREKADADLLVPFNWASAEWAGEHYRVNGQHIAAMLAQLNGQLPEDAKVHHDQYRVHSREGLALLFRQFDDRASGRSSADVAGAYQGLHPNLADVNRRAAKVGIEGIAWWRRHVEGLPVPTGDSQYELFNVESLHGFLIWLGQLLTSKTRELERPTITAAIFGTFDKNEAEAKTFWAAVARGGVEFEDGHPATVLDNWLKAYREDPKGQKAVQPANFYQGCIFAWNAYREGRQITSVKSDARKGLHPIAE